MGNNHPRSHPFILNCKHLCSQHRSYLDLFNLDPTSGYELTDSRRAFSFETLNGKIVTISFLFREYWGWVEGRSWAPVDVTWRCFWPLWRPRRLARPGIDSDFQIFNSATLLPEFQLEVETIPALFFLPRTKGHIKRHLETYMIGSMTRSKECCFWRKREVVM